MSTTLPARLSRRRVLGFLGLGAIAATALAACSGSATPPAATAAPATAPTTAAGLSTTTAGSATQPAVTPATGAASPVAQGSAQAATTAELLIGAPLGTTGANSVEGGLTKNGYDLWTTVVNDAGGIKAGGKAYKVTIKYYDDGSNPNQSAQLTERLLSQDNVQLLFGPYGSSNTEQAAAIAEKHQVPMIEGNGAAQSIFSHGYKYIFGTLSPAPQYSAIMLQMATTLTPKPASVAVLSADDAFSLEVAKGAVDFAGANGMQVLVNEKYPANSTDLSSVVTKAKQANADIMLNSGHLPESLAIMKSAKELDYNPKLFCFTVGPTTPDFLKTLTTGAEYVVSSSQWTPSETWQGTDIFGTPKKYSDLYQKAFSSIPDYHAADGSSVGVAMQAAIEKAGSIDAQAVRNALSTLDIQTFYGPIKFDATGANPTHPMAVQQIQKGVLLTVFPTNVAEAKALYPTPPWSGR